MGRLDKRDTPAWALFHQTVCAAAAAGGEPVRIVEVGTRRWGPNSTHHRDRFPPDVEYTMVDAMGGVDVDRVCDIHEIASVLGDSRYAGVACCSVLEHVERPWVAVEQMCRLLASGGALYVQTHQTFPVHGYPSDYWRFTREALASLAPDGFDVVTSYAHPCKIVPDPAVDPWNTAPDVEAWLNVDMCVIAG